MDDPTVRLLTGLVMLLLVAVVGFGTLLALMAVRRKHDRQHRATIHRRTGRPRRDPVPDAWTEAGRRYQQAQDEAADDDTDSDIDTDSDSDSDSGSSPDDRQRPPDREP